MKITDDDQADYAVKVINKLLLVINKEIKDMHKMDKKIMEKLFVSLYSAISEIYSRFVCTLLSSTINTNGVKDIEKRVNSLLNGVKKKIIEKYNSTKNNFITNQREEVKDEKENS